MTMTDYKSKAIELLTCPDDWESIFSNLATADSNFLLLDWYYCHQMNSAGGDERTLILHFADYNYDPGDFDTEEWRSACLNLENRRETSVRMYNERAHKLADLRYLSPDYNCKHFRYGKGIEDIKRTTNIDKSISILVENYSPERLHAAFGMWLAYFFTPAVISDEASMGPIIYDYIAAWDPDGRYHSKSRFQIWKALLTRSNVRVAFDAVETVGFKAGQELHHLCFDIDLSSKTLHSYPVTESEAISIMGHVDDVILNKPMWW